ncbi:hypothetical protein LR003_02010 [candidate division NPL-UPA2 bacterium]|nr:hypothetical protein [candidate division NPL-UPA2 bacterium]
MSLFKKPCSIHLYNEGSSSTLNLEEVAVYLRERLGKVEVNCGNSLISDYLSHFSEEKKEIEINSLAGKLAGIKIRRLGEEQSFSPPLKGEIEYEKKYFQHPSSKPAGILYDGFWLQNIFCEVIPKEYLSRKHLHLLFTNQLFGTWDENDRRYHARTSVYGCPSLISTTGIVEAPAKPREFYLLRQQYDLLGKREASMFKLKESFKGRFIDYDDERLTEVVKGYCLQAIFFHLTGDPFCHDQNCRLYNAHWQEELITAQLKGGYELCPDHQGILSRF